MSATPASQDQSALLLVRTHLRSALQTAEPCRGLVVALSGGLDSSVLLHALAMLDWPERPPLRAIHINHGLQAAAAEFEKAARALAAELRVPCSVVRVQVQTSALGLEGGARVARYNALASTLAAGEWLLSAHHDDDQAETMLARLARAAGSSAMRGIAASRPLGAGQLRRPLLGLTRADLRTYAEIIKLNWCEDPMNAQADLERSFLRHQVLPLLRSRWPDFASQAARAATLLQPAIAAAASDTRRQLAEVQLADPTTLDLDALLRQPEQTIPVLIRTWLTDLGLATPSARGLDELLRQLRAGSEALHQERQGVFIRQYRRVLYAGQSRNGAATLADDQDWDGRVALHWSNQRVYQLSAPLEAPLQVRYRRGGERIRLRDSGRAQEVRDLFQRYGLPPWQRDLPFFFAHGELLAVGDLWQSEAFRRYLGTATLRSRTQAMGAYEPDSVRCLEPRID